jgi:hypothetical protein
VAELTAVDAETAAQIEAVFAELAGVSASSAPVVPDPAAEGFDQNLAPGQIHFGDLLHFTEPDESRGTTMEAYLTQSMLPTPGSPRRRPGVPAGRPLVAGQLRADRTGRQGDRRTEGVRVGFRADLPGGPPPGQRHPSAVDGRGAGRPGATVFDPDPFARP